MFAQRGGAGAGLKRLPRVMACGSGTCLLADAGLLMREIENLKPPKVEGPKWPLTLSVRMWSTFLDRLNPIFPSCKHENPEEFKSSQLRRWGRMQYDAVT